MRCAEVLLFALSAASVGCSWTRFDDVTEDTPAVELVKPTKLGAGFGVTLATASAGDRVHLLVGGSAGASPAASFDLGLGEDPIVDAIDTGFCDQTGGKCFLANRVAALATADVGRGKHDLCFVIGIGRTQGVKEEGLVVRCADALEYTLPVPKPVIDRIVEPHIRLNNESQPLYLASDKDPTPAVVAGAPAQELAWFYAPGGDEPRELVAPADAPDESYGSAVASVRLGGDARLLAVAAPDSGHVWLFRAEGDSASPVGCLGGPKGFGRVLASGPVDEDAADELVVADRVNVSVFSGKALAALVPARSVTCSLASLPEGGLVASFGCGSRDDTAGCPGDFGAAVEVGDLDGDGDGEVVVGAPDMDARGVSGAGAVLVYDVEGDHPEELNEQRFLSSAEDGDELGAAIALPRIKGRSVIAAGAAGNGKTVLFYCSSLLGDHHSARCN